MASFGEKLRKEREKRGVTLDEIAAATKISARNLRALESEKFDQLPGGIFNKGFVRAYAKFVGLDEDQALADYVAAAGELANPELPLPDPPQDSGKTDLESIRRNSGSLGSMFVFAVIVLLIYGGWTFYGKKKERDQAAADRAEQQQQTEMPAARAPEPQLTAAKPDSTPAVTPAVASTSAASASVPTAITVSVRASEDCWVSAKADSHSATEGKLAATHSKIYHAASQLELTLGNASAVEVFYNGKPVNTLGEPGSVKKITFTPEGYW